MIDYPIIWIHNSDQVRVLPLDNSIPDGIKYSKVDLTSYGTGDASTLKLVVEKFQNGKLMTDRLKFLGDDCYISFVYRGRNYFFTIVKYTETDWTIEMDCDSVSLAFINEQAPAYTADRAITIAQYIEDMQLFRDNDIIMGVNEISKEVVKLDYKKGSTLLKRILDLVEAFSAEVSFDTVLKPNGAIDHLVMNLYKKRSNKYPNSGVGMVRHDVRLSMDRNLTSIKRSTDKSKIYTALRLLDKDDKVITFKKSYALKTADGSLNDVVAFKNGNTLYAPLAMRLYPAVARKNECDRWIVNEVQLKSTEGMSEEDIWVYGSELLYQNAYPVVNYDVTFDYNNVMYSYNLRVGDTIYISDDNFVGGLLLTARINQLEENIVDGTVKMKLANITEIATQIPQSLSDQVSALVKETAPYTMKLPVDNGVTFKNEIEKSTIKPELYRNDELIKEATFYYQDSDGNNIGLGSRFTVYPEHYKNDKCDITVIAYVGGKDVARDTLQFTLVMDGSDGAKLKRSFTVYKQHDSLSAPAFDQSEIVTTEGMFVEGYDDSKWNSLGWSLEPLHPTSDQKYVFSIRIDEYDDGTAVLTKPAIFSMYGTKGDKGDAALMGGRNYAEDYAYERNLWFATNGSNKPDTVVFRNGTAELKTVPNTYSQIQLSTNPAHYKTEEIPVALNELEEGVDYHLSFEARILSNHSTVTVTGDLRENKTSGTNNIIRVVSKPLTQSWTRFTGTAVLTKSDDFSYWRIVLHSNQPVDAVIGIRRVELVRGSEFSDAGEAPEDTLWRSNRKADNEFVQQQLNVLTEEQRRQNAEMAALAAMEDVDELTRFVSMLQTATEEGRKQVEADLSEVANRLTKNVEEVGDMKLITNFVDTYMSQSEEGLIIGKRESSEAVMVSNDRISFVSAGTEVAFISQGLLHIENGVFTTSIQIGHFVTKAHHENERINVTYYIE